MAYYVWGQVAAIRASDTGHRLTLELRPRAGDTSSGMARRVSTLTVEGAGLGRVLEPGEFVR